MKENKNKKIKIKTKRKSCKQPQRKDALSIGEYQFDWEQISYLKLQK